MTLSSFWNGSMELEEDEVKRKSMALTRDNQHQQKFKVLSLISWCCSNIAVSIRCSNWNFLLSLNKQLFLKRFIFCFRFVLCAFPNTRVLYFQFGFGFDFVLIVMVDFYRPYQTAHIMCTSILLCYLYALLFYHDWHYSWKLIKPRQHALFA